MQHLLTSIKKKKRKQHYHSGLVKVLMCMNSSFITLKNAAAMKIESFQYKLRIRRLAHCYITLQGDQGTMHIMIILDEGSLLNI